MNAFPISGDGYEFGTGVCIVNQNEIIVTGYFSSDSVDFDPGPVMQNLYVAGSNVFYSDAFVASYTTEAVSVNENDAGEKFIVYPNPVTDKLIIDQVINGNDQVELTIFDLMGKKIIYSTCTTAKCTIDVSKMEEGIYFIQMKNGNQSATQKFIKL